MERTHSLLNVPLVVPTLMAVSKKDLQRGKNSGNKQKDAEYLDLMINALFSWERAEIKLAAQKATDRITVLRFWWG
jgi:hypothetical protein